MFKRQPSFVIGFRLRVICVITCTFRMEACNLFMDGYFLFRILFIVNCFTNFYRITCRCFGDECAIESFFGGFFPVNARCFMFFFERSFLRSTGIFRGAILMTSDSESSIISNRVARCTTFGLCLRNVFFRFRFRAANRFNFIRSAFTCRCDSQLIVRVVRRNLQGVTSIN